MINVTLIRHGKTAGNLRKAYIGATDEPLDNSYISGINPKQFPQAEIVFSSPLKRCLQTAAIIYPCKKNIIYNDLRECDFGDFEGKTYEQLKDNAYYQTWLDSGGTTAFPNGEEQESFRTRCVNAFLELCEIDADRIAVVCHGGTIMAILDKISNPHSDFYNWQVENLSGYSFDYDKDLKIATNITKLG